MRPGSCKSVFRPTPSIGIGNCRANGLEVNNINNKKANMIDV